MKKRKKTHFDDMNKDDKLAVVQCMQNNIKKDVSKIMGVSQSTIDKICDELFNRRAKTIENYEKF